LAAQRLERGDPVAKRNAPDYGLEALRRDLKRGAPEPLYVVEGEEALLADEAVQALVDAAVPAAGRDFNLDVFAGDDETGRQFLAQARSYPFLGERRAVVVRRFDKLAWKNPRDEAAFLEYVGAPAATTVLVLVATKLDRRTTLAKTLDGAARIVAVKGMDEGQLPGWVARRLQARGVSASDAAVRRLVEISGPSLLDLANEVEKVAARYGGATPVGEAEIDATVGLHRVEEIWAINRAFRPGDPGGFLRALGRALETQEPILLLAVLARHVNDVLRTRVLLDSGVSSPFKLAGLLHRPPQHIENELLPQARAFTRAQILLWMRNLQRADVRLKSTGVPPRWTLEQAMLNSFMGREMA
jgi:DNA polymerase-3 subunit delta